jgi:hypothetical protein
LCKISQVFTICDAKIFVDSTLNLTFMSYIQNISYVFYMYFFQNTGTLHHIKDSRAYTLFRKLQFWGNFRGFSDEKLLRIFSLKSGVFRGFFSSMGWQPWCTSCTEGQWILKVHSANDSEIFLKARFLRAMTNSNYEE